MNRGSKIREDKKIIGGDEDSMQTKAYLEKAEYYKKATSYLGSECEKQRRVIQKLKKKIEEAEEDNSFYERQITEERSKKVSSQIKEYVTFIQDAQRLFGIDKIPASILDDEENISQNIEPEKSTGINMMDVYKNIGRSRPTTGYINQRVQLSQSSEAASRFDYGASRANDEIMSLNNYGFSQRNIQSAIPRVKTKTCYRRESIKRKTDKNMRHGKFSKFLDYLLEIKNDSQNTTADEISSVMKTNESSYHKIPKKIGMRNMSAPGRPRKRPTKEQISDYIIMTIAKEAENYFKLDTMRKQRIRDSLADKLFSEKKKIDRFKGTKSMRYNARKDPLLQRSVVINELEKAIMIVSEEMMQRRIKTSISNSKSKNVDVKQIQSQHLSNIGESFFKSSDKRKILRLFCNSESIKEMIEAYSKGESESLVFLKPGMKDELVNNPE
ncbi:unnamed protein product [Moneuplotes crassus]|uniref:Uncharacterized protein n=2 Tax=Euplotes crassus TaxID=5936 RepID=A0AAD1XCW9_EUPCR|nr:unnamed protein product [Moneuplotes crassus]